MLVIDKLFSSVALKDANYNKQKKKGRTLKKLQKQIERLRDPGLRSRGLRCRLRKKIPHFVRSFFRKLSHGET